MLESIIQASVNTEREPIIIKDQCFSQDIWTTDYITYVTQAIPSKVPDPQRLFYDTISRRYFKTTFSQVLQAEYHLNRNYILGMDVTANTWYSFVGLDTIPEDDNKMWYEEDGIYWIDFNHVLDHTPSGEEVIRIDLPFEPYSMVDAK